MKDLLAENNINANFIIHNDIIELELAEIEEEEETIPLDTAIDAIDVLVDVIAPYLDGLDVDVIKESLFKSLCDGGNYRSYLISQFTSKLPDKMRKYLNILEL